MRITAIRSLDFANGNYRALFPLQQLARRGHDVSINLEGEPRFNLRRLLRSDLVLIHRLGDDEVLRLIPMLQEQGVAVVWDDDDDLTSIPKESPLYRRMGGVNASRALLRLRRILASVDAVTTPSHVLAQRFAAAGAEHVHVLENYVPTHIEPVVLRRTPPLTVGWVAGLEHQVDAQRLRIAETLERLLAANPSIQVVTVGLSLGLRSERYGHVPKVQYDALPNLIGHFDVGIAPVSDSSFNRARSNIKVKEYAIIGVPWLASDVPAYAGLGEKQGGRLVADAGWHAALDTLLRDAKARVRLSKNAGKWAKTQRIDQHAAEWERVFEATLKRFHSRSGADRTAAQTIAP